MAEYYLISQLPSLDGLSENGALPITEARFTELCERFLGKKAQSALKTLTLTPPRQNEATGFALIDAWNESERSLRLALCKVRAEKMKKPFDTDNKLLPPEYVKASAAAMEIDNPMEAEQYLNRVRLDILEALRPMDSFSDDYVFYYGLKLKLLARVRQFDKQLGEQEYRNIYDSILSGERLEAI